MKEDKIRQELHKYLDAADDETLHFLKEVIHAYQSEKKNEVIQQFDPNKTTPMTMEEFESLIERAEENIRHGKVYSNEEVKAMLRSRNVKV